MRTVRAADIERAPITWLWREHIPEGMIAGIAGRPGQGKSLLAVHIAAEVSQHHPVIVSTVEDPLRQVAKPRIEAAGADMDRVHFAKPAHEPLPEGLDALEAVIRETGAKLVIADPIAAHLTTRITEDQAVRRALTPLAAMCEELGCTYLVIAHVVKSIPANAEPLQAVGGSGGGLAGACRVMYLLGRSPEDAEERILAPLKCNISAEPSSLSFELDSHSWDDGVDAGLLVYRGESDLGARAVLDASRPPADPTKREEAAEWLEDYLRAAGQPVLQRQIIEDAVRLGFTERTVRRASTDLGIVKPKGGPNSCWSLPEGA